MFCNKRPLPIGKKFNKLEILHEVPTTEKCRRYVRCRCECGSEKTVRYDGIKSGRVKSCGCLLSHKNENHISAISVSRKKTEIRKAEEYIGRKFNKLTIISIDHSKSKSRWFNVRCDCGNTLSVSLTRMKLGHTKSCGCARRWFKEIEFVSEIDGERLSISGSKQEYYRILGTKEKEPLHIHEAKKMFRMSVKEWPSAGCVHHLDGDKRNNSPSNLYVFPNNRDHHLYHADISRAMYQFMHKNHELDKFFEENPTLKLI